MNKKRKFLCFGIFFLILILLGGKTMKISASDEEKQAMPEEYQGFLGALPDAVTDKLPSSALSGERDAVLNSAKELMSVEFLLTALLDAFGGAVTSIIPTLALLLGIVILSSLCHIFSNSFGGLSGAVSLAARLCSYCAIAAVTVSALSGLKEYFEALFTAVAAFVPLSGVLYAMGGNFMGAAAGSATLSTTLAVCQFFFSKTVIPVFCTCVSLSLISVFDGVGASAARSVSSTVKKWYTTALAFIMMILTTAIAGQGLLSAKADSAAMKGAKFAASSFIPISGGALSSTLGTLVSSVELLRGSVGVIGIVIILLMLISVIVRLAAMRGVLALSSFAAGMLGCTGEQRLLDEIGSLYGYLEGIAAISAVTFMIAMAVFATTAAAVTV